MTQTYISRLTSRHLWITTLNEKTALRAPRTSRNPNYVSSISISNFWYMRLRMILRNSFSIMGHQTNDSYLMTYDFLGREINYYDSDHHSLGITPEKQIWSKNFSKIPMCFSSTTFSTHLDRQLIRSRAFSTPYIFTAYNISSFVIS